MGRSTTVTAVLAATALSLAACGGSDDGEKPTPSPPPQTSAQTTPQTTETITADGLVACIAERGKAQKLTTDTSGDLSVGGLTTDQYETVAVEEDGGLAAQVLVFPSIDEAGKAVEIIEKEGFWDDVRPGGNLVMLPRGGSEPALDTIQGCFPAA